MEVIDELREMLNEKIKECQEIEREFLKPFPKTEEFDTYYLYLMARDRYINDRLETGKYSTTNLQEALEAKSEYESKLLELSNIEHILKRK